MKRWCSCSSVASTHRLLYGLHLFMEAAEKDSFISIVVSAFHTELGASAAREKWALSKLNCLLAKKYNKYLLYYTSGLFSEGADSCIGHVITFITRLAYLVKSMSNWTLVFLKESQDFRIQIRGIPVGNQAQILFILPQPASHIDEVATDALVLRLCWSGRHPEKAFGG